MSHKVGIITQARTTSTRLPRKVLLQVNKKTVLEYQIERLKKSGLPIYVATTINETDKEIVELCKKIKIPFYQGSEHDVLSRYYECAFQNDLDTIIRVTSDCPLIDGEIIKKALLQFQKLPSNSYLSNCIERTFPTGFDFEIFNLQALKYAKEHATDQYDREHVTPFIRNPKKNKDVNIVHFKRDKDASRLRITLDENDDWTLIQTLIEKHQADKKSAEEIIQILEKDSQLTEINSHVQQKKQQ